jgi:phage-related protein
LDVFKIFGSFLINNDEANKAIDETTGKAESASGSLGKAFGSIAKGVAVAVGACATAIGAMTKQAVDAYADYEQLVGGMGKIFSDMNTSIIAQDASNAYKDLGMSASEYLAIINDVGASFASTMGDEAGYEAVKKGLTAISDYASGTGKNFNELQQKLAMITRSTSSYQSIADQFSGILPATSEGFLRQAQSAGFLSAEYKKLTEVPIEEYQKAVTEMLAQGVDGLNLTGNTANEATTTISGSLSMLKASWANTLVALADDEADFSAVISQLVDSVTAVFTNVLPIIQAVFQAIPELVNQLAPQIPAIVQTILPALLESAIGLLNSLVAQLPTLIGIIINALSSQAPMLLTTIGDLLVGMADFIQTNLPIFTEKAKEMVSGLGQKIKENLPEIISTGLDILLGLSESILTNLPQLVATGMDLIMSLIQGIISAFPELIAKAPLIISNIANSISNSIQTILFKGVEIIWALIKGIIGAIPDLIANFPQVIQAIFDVWNAINWLNLGKNLITGITNGIKNMGGSLKNTAKDLFTKLGNSIDDIFNGIKNSITHPINTAKNLFNTAVSGIKNLGLTAFNNLKSNVTSIFNGIKSAITNPIDTAKNIIKGLIDSIVKMFSGAKFSWPNIPMPHFSISPSGWKIADLLKGRIPKLGISWYAKAMDNPMLFTRPTLFDVNPVTGQARGAGEAGDEVMIGKNTMLNMIQEAVAQENAVMMDSVNNVLNRIFDLLAEYIPEMGRTQLVLDTGVMVGELAPAMDTALGAVYRKRKRGV